VPLPPQLVLRLRSGTLCGHFFGHLAIGATPLFTIRFGFLLEAA
jgi:hypothetical protein